jgi:hypothetical protein
MQSRSRPRSWGVKNIVAHACHVPMYALLSRGINEMSKSQSVSTIAFVFHISLRLARFSIGLRKCLGRLYHNFYAISDQGRMTYIWLFLIRFLLTRLLSPPSPSPFSHCRYGTLPFSTPATIPPPLSKLKSSIPHTGSSSSPFTMTLH